MTVRLVLSDVDGTLVTSDKVLTDRSIEAVHRLREAGVKFAVTSGRPPRGMAMLVGPLSLATPIAAFNGGLVVEPDMVVVDQKTIPDKLVASVIQLLESFRLNVWVYRGADWFVQDLEGPHVQREALTVQFEPTVADSYDGLTSVAKIVGVSDDHEAVERASATAQHEFGDHVSASRSQPYYLDVTHPNANKGAVVRFLSETYDIPPEQIATLGDMPNDVLMFAHSGLSIAMGQSDREVQRAARRVTASNDDDGFAEAVDRYILRN